MARRRAALRRSQHSDLNLIVLDWLPDFLGKRCAPGRAQSAAAIYPRPRRSLPVCVASLGRRLYLTNLRGPDLRARVRALSPALAPRRSTANAARCTRLRGASSFVGAKSPRYFKRVAISSAGHRRRQVFARLELSMRRPAMATPRSEPRSAGRRIRRSSYKLGSTWR